MLRDILFYPIKIYIQKDLLLVLLSFIDIRIYILCVYFTISQYSFILNKSDCFQKLYTRTKSHEAGIPVYWQPILF